MQHQRQLIWIGLLPAAREEMVHGRSRRMQGSSVRDGDAEGC